MEERILSYVYYLQGSSSVQGPTSSFIRPYHTVEFVTDGTLDGSGKCGQIKCNRLGGHESVQVSICKQRNDDERNLITYNDFRSSSKVYSFAAR